MIVATENTGTAFTGTYLTDGHDLYCVGVRVGDADLWEVEDCRTLGVLLLSGPELRHSALRPVWRPCAAPRIGGAELLPAAV